MSEPEFYHEIFAQAKALGLLLNQFCQLSDGSFRANWRTADEAPLFSNCATDRDPLHCLTNSLTIARNTITRPEVHNPAHTLIEAPRRRMVVEVVPTTPARRRIV